jgi:hypothetical protein
MWLLRRSRTQPDEHDIAAPALRLVNGYDSLSDAEGLRVADRLYVLFKWFMQDFGDLQSFLQRPAAEQENYLRTLEVAAARSASLPGTAFAESYYALAMLECYIRLLQGGRRSPVARALADRVVSAINDGTGRRTDKSSGWQSPTCP